jgi:hypothetical protein
VKITIYTTDRKHVSIEDMGTDTIQPMVDALTDPDVYVLAFNLDDTAMTYIIKANIARVDID